LLKTGFFKNGVILGVAKVKESSLNPSQSNNRGIYMKKMKMNDDFQDYLIEGAVFDGDIDIPCMLSLNNIIIPKKLAPYTERKRIKNKNVVLHCFIHDFLFLI